MIQQFSNYLYVHVYSQQPCSQEPEERKSQRMDKQTVAHTHSKELFNHSKKGSARQMLKYGRTLKTLHFVKEAGNKHLLSDSTNMKHPESVNHRGRLGVGLGRMEELGATD